MCPGGEHESSSKVKKHKMRICPSVLFREQSVAVKQLWGTIQWLWQCNFQHTLGYTLLRWSTTHWVFVAWQMVEKRSQKNTNIYNDTYSPSSHPDLPSAGTKMKLAQAQHCYITTMWKQNQFIRLTATHSLKKTKPASGTPPPPGSGMARWGAGGRGDDCLAALVVRLYCAPLIGLCRGRKLG